MVYSARRLRRSTTIADDSDAQSKGGAAATRLLRTRSTNMSETMMTAGFDEIVRARAYALWESEGRPFGRDAEHWRMSEEEARSDLERLATTKATSQTKTKAPTRKKAAAKRAAMGAEAFASA
jgi:hypothetical protein